MPRNLFGRRPKPDTQRQSTPQQSVPQAQDTQQDRHKPRQEPRQEPAVAAYAQRGG